MLCFESSAFTRLRRASHFPLIRHCAAGAARTAKPAPKGRSAGCAESRKVTKGKTTPAYAPIGLRPIGTLRCSPSTGRQTTRPSMASDSLPFPGGRLRSSALLQGTRRSRARLRRGVTLLIVRSHAGTPRITSRFRLPGESRDPFLRGSKGHAAASAGTPARTTGCQCAAMLSSKASRRIVSLSNENDAGAVAGESRPLPPAAPFKSSGQALPLWARE